MIEDNLLYVQSKNHTYVRETLGHLLFTDKNFARKVMQLFTIRTVLLNDNKMLKHDTDTEKEINTYSNVAAQHELCKGVDGI